MRILCVNSQDKAEVFKSTIGDIISQGMDACNVDDSETLQISFLDDINDILPTIKEEHFDCVISVEKLEEASLGAKTIKNIIEITNLIIVSKDGDISYSKRTKMFDEGFYNLIYLDRDMTNKEFYLIAKNGRSKEEAIAYYEIESKNSNEEINTNPKGARRTVVFENQETAATAEVNQISPSEMTVKSYVGEIIHKDQQTITIIIPEELKGKDSTFVVTLTAINNN